MKKVILFLLIFVPIEIILIKLSKICAVACLPPPVICQTHCSFNWPIFLIATLVNLIASFLIVLIISFLLRKIKK
jgi:hypothetical protein